MHRGRSACSLSLYLPVTFLQRPCFEAYSSCRPVFRASWSFRLADSYGAPFAAFAALELGIVDSYA